MRVTSKGQVTVPKVVREKLGIKPGDEVGFREAGNSFIVEKAVTPDGESRGERMARILMEEGARLRREGKLLDPDMSTDEYMELIRGYSEDAVDPGFKHHR